MGGVFTPSGNVAQGELSSSVVQLLAIRTSCAYGQLSNLTVAQRQQLSSALTSVRSLLGQSRDQTSAEQGLVQTQIQSLQNQIHNLGNPQAPLFQVMNLLQRATNACPEVQNFVLGTQAQATQAVAGVEELQYRLSLARIAAGNLLLDLQQVQSDLAYLDQLQATIQQLP